MATRAFGQLFVQPAAPQEDPVMVGSLWSDTTTNLLKFCTSISPYTFVQASAGFPIDLESEVTGVLPAANGGTAVTTGLSALDASNLNAGTVAVARLGAGTFSAITSTTTGATNNWAPTLVGNTFIEWNGASGAQFTGLDGGVVGQIAIVKNITAAQIATFAHDSGSSDADNQFQNSATSAPTPIAPGGWIAYQHDGTDWKLIGHEQGAWITATFAAGNFASDVGSWTVESGDVSTMAYRLNGRTLQVAWYLITTSVSGTPSQLHIGNGAWGGFTVARAMLAITLGNSAGAGNEPVFSQVLGGATVITNNQVDGGSWANATNTTGLFGQMALEVS